MARFNFEVEREIKRKRSSRSKSFRILLLFCVMAIITMAVIYAIIPRSAPEENKANSQNGNTPVETEEKTQEKTETGKKESSLPENPVSAGKDKAENISTPADKSKNEENITGTQTKNPAAKFQPSSDELLKLTAQLRKSLADGSWKKSKDIIIHRVSRGDSLEKIARKYHTTRQFLQKFNHIDDPDTIRIGQKIYCFAADSWSVTISRGKSYLLVDRIFNGQAVPFAIFPCLSDSNICRDELVISRRFSEPFLVDGQGRKFAPGTPENPFGEGQLTLARKNTPDLHLAYSIHGKGPDPQALSSSLKNGSVALDNPDIELLYCLLPEKTAVQIIK